jgi:succinate dehydrogenase/fumarate reductase flavoprotein subunit
MEKNSNNVIKNQTNETDKTDEKININSAITLYKSANKRSKRFREKNRDRLAITSQKKYIKKFAPNISDDKIQELITIKKEYSKNNKELKTNINKLDETITSLEKLQKTYEEVYKKTKYEQVMLKLQKMKKKRDKESEK